MKRSLLAALVLGVMGLATVAIAVSGWHNYKDKFDSGGYSGNDGSLQWTGPWREEGESDGPGSGNVRVQGSGCSGQCLTIGGDGLATSDDGAYRLADLGDFADAKLSYSVGYDGGLLGLGTTTLTVSVTEDGGQSWSPVDSDLVLIHGAVYQRSVNVSGRISEGFGVRFIATGSLGTIVRIDNVEIAGSVPVPTTTTAAATTTTATTVSTTTTLTNLPPTTLPKVTTTTLITLPPPTLPNLSTTSTTTTKTTTTTTTVRTTSTTTTTTADLEAGGSTTTIDSGETTTTVVAGAGGDDDDPGDGTGLRSGLRQTSIGVGSDVPSGLFGSTPEVLSFEVAAGYANAVELIEASWVWVLGLALMIAAALIKGIDRRLDHEPARDEV